MQNQSVVLPYRWLPAESLLRNAGFLRVWLAATIAVLGESVSHLALPLTAAQVLNASAGEMGLLFAAGTLPFALFSLPAGVWLDRRRKQRIVVVFDMLGGAALAMVPIAHYFGHLSMGILYAAHFAVGTCFAVGGSAAQVFLTGLVGRDRLVEANSLQATANSVAGLAGPVLAGLLVAAFGAPTAVAVDAMAFLGSAVLIATVRTVEPPLPEALRSPLHDLLEGLRFVWRHPLLRVFAMMAAMCIILFDGFMALYVLHATRDLGLAAGQIALVNALGAVGALAGAVAVHGANRRFGKAVAIVLGFGATGAGFLLYALAPPGDWAVPLAGAAMFLVEGGMTAYTVNYLAMRQQVTPDAMLGRMTTTMRFLSVSGAPVGSTVIGYAAGAIGLTSMIAILGVMALMAAAWSRRLVADPVAVPLATPAVGPVE
jgi:Na+/melibiose symporter-like transporter